MSFQVNEKVLIFSGILLFYTVFIMYERNQKNSLKEDLIEQEARKATFKTWIFNSNKPCNANKMAEAGFIFTGSSKEPDSVQCFFCKKSLDGWEANDDPWSEHLKHAPQCSFAKMQAPQDCWTFSEYLAILKEYKGILVRKKFDDVKKHTKKVGELHKKYLVR